MAPPSNLTIGFLTTGIGDGTGRLLWSGILDQCQALGVNLVSFVGNQLANPSGFSRQANAVFDLVDRNQLDGLVIWASSLAAFVGPETGQRFCDRFRPLPMVAIGMPLAGIPSLILDSYQGMREVLLHLVRDHGRRRLAFLRGPDMHYEAQRRYQAYQDVVREYGLENDPGLVTPPYTWLQSWGAEATRILVEDRRKSFDTLVGVNDGLAVGAMQYLREHGVDVPGEVAVTGFDNTLDGRVITPPLTTVRIRMRERGRQAVRLLLQQIGGEIVPGLITLPPELIVRQSCGCPDQLVVGAGQVDPLRSFAVSPRPGLASMRLRTSQKSAILAELEHSLDLEDAPQGWAGELFEAFLASSQPGGEGRFLQVLQHLLHQTEPQGGELTAWQRVISVLRMRALSFLQGNPRRIEQADLNLHQARVMVGETALRAQSYLDLLSSQQTNSLIRIRQGVTAARTLDNLADILARELPALGIHRCYLALYQDPNHPLEGARLALAYDETRRYSEREGQVFSPSTAFSLPAPPGSGPLNFALHPLYFRDDSLGFILLDARTFQGTAHQVLCEQLSSALKSVLLIDQNIRLYYQALEAKRMAEEADLLKSRFLSMVSHELLTPMVLLVGLSEMMLREGIGDRPSLPEVYRQDLTRIHASAQQLGSLVRDVLDLSRSQLGQLKLTRKPVKINEVLKPVALVGEQMARSKGLAWRVEIPADLPEVQGDASRLQQVALNLVSNAVKFTTQGEVALIAQLDDGQVTVAVQDTGLGVPLSEQEAIFDEFHQSERTVARGYGGLGIGLAICRQLIELHDGRIGVQSGGEENSGSTFYFSLPALSRTSEAAVAGGSPSGTVLILTDHAAHSAALQAHLVSQGYLVDVLGIDETPGWLERILTALPGAVVLDVPVAGRGWELIETFKSNPATQEMPVIFYSLLTGQRGGSVLELDYLAKPAATASLGQVLQRYGLVGGNCEDPRTVLVVDDDPAILDLHARLVAEHIPGCRVLQAADGQAALDQMRLQPPALVLLDLRMPHLDGVGVLRAMQEDGRLRGVPVIVMTAQSLTQEEMSSLGQGVEAVLAKGVFTSDETLAHIDRALARSKRLGSEAQRLVRRLMAYIHEHYAEPLSRQEMASFAGVSERHLNRCFLQETSLTPVAYLNRYRIQKAKELLKEGRLNITEVMGAVGFSDSSYFTRVFRREAGMAPREYQRKRT